ncbi:hypothetical protein VNI00_015485 [Paramarasmius palmivorus]|uniref:PH domain-containing protein n=1 Tax=Paramarasmius palmivorus TaxID=297713 RepID=A0AAW0BJX3_9AGAR
MTDQEELSFILLVFTILEQSGKEDQIFFQDDEEADQQRWFQRLLPLLRADAPEWPPKRKPKKTDWDVLKLSCPEEKTSRIQQLRNRRSNYRSRRRDTGQKRQYYKPSLESSSKRQKTTDERSSVEYDLYTKFHIDNQREVVWDGNGGSRLRTCVPYKVDESGCNVLAKAGQVVKALAAFGHVEQSTEDVQVIDKSQGSHIVESLVSACISMNKPLLAKGSRAQQSWDDGLDSKHFPALHIESQRQVEVFDFVKSERQALVDDSERSKDDREFEMIVQPEPTVLEHCPVAPSNVAEPFLPRNKMSFEQFLESLNDFERALDNTKTFHELISWPDVLWALAHAGNVITWWHHDADGKMTIINAETGAKVWTLFVPNPALSATEVHRIQSWLAGSKDKLPKPELGKIINILLLPGDTLSVCFMPPGMLHLVLTPVPAIFRGSSFWIMSALHLTQWSRVIDSNHGDILTNVDHSESTIFQSLVRMALGIPVVESLVVYRRGIIALYDMLINNESYIPLFEGDPNYPSEQEVQRRLPKKSRKSRGKRKEEHTGQDLAQQMADSLQFCIDEVRFSIATELKDNSPHYNVAITVLESILDSMGKAIPKLDADKKIASAHWVKAELESDQWFEAGPSISIDRARLRALYPREYEMDCKVVC